MKPLISFFNFFMYLWYSHSCCRHFFPYWALSWCWIILTSNASPHLHITSLAELLFRTQISFLILVVPYFVLRPCTADIDVSVSADLTL